MKIKLLGMFAMMAIGATGCGLSPGGTASGGGTLPSATCGVGSPDPACKDKAVFGGHVDCTGPSGKAAFTYRDAKAGVVGRVDQLVPIDVNQPACGSEQSEAAAVLAFAGVWNSKNAPEFATVILGVNATGTDVDALGIGVGPSCVILEGDCTYVNIQQLTHGNVVLH